MSTISIPDKVDRYLALPPMPLYMQLLDTNGQVTLEPFNVLVWWRQHKQHFPCVASLACHHLSLLGTSVLSEQVFSLAKWMFPAQQTLLKDYNIETLLFLNINANHYPTLL
jgi:hypothetical protein